jgi:hypothetical protein
MDSFDLKAIGSYQMHCSGDGAHWLIRADTAIVIISIGANVKVTVYFRAMSLLYNNRIMILLQTG